MNRSIIVAATVTLAVGFVAGWLLKPCPMPTGMPRPVQAENEVVLDTVYRTVVRAPIHVGHTRANVRTHGPVVAYTEVSGDDGHSDTLLAAQPFVMALDTAMGQDTIHVEARFPPPTLAIAIRSVPDSVLDRTILVTQTVREERTWYEDAGRALFFAGCGYLVRVLTEGVPERGHTERARLPPSDVAARTAVTRTALVSLTIPIR